MEQDSKFQANSSLENNSQGRVPSSVSSPMAWAMWAATSVGCSWATSS